MADQRRRVHLIGIGGVGMSALAQALLDAGCEVSGADRLLNADPSRRTGVLAALERQGAKIFPDDGSGVRGCAVDEVIVSTAIEPDNPGLAAARERGIGVTHRAAALAKLLEGKKLVAVAGTCGKSTVTALLGHILAECGFDPLVVNGAQVAGWDEGGARVGAVRKPAGATQWAVAEVDESDKSLAVFKPYAAVVTNASADHYGLDEMNEVFDAFVRGVGGPVLDGRREAIVPGAAARAVKMPGGHNAVNAETALRMALALGAEPQRAAAAVASFRGVERRLQYAGRMAGGAAVYDDYAHNPEKLRAMIAALHEAYEGNLAVVWRPHGYAPLRKTLDALAEMFAAALGEGDLLVLPPVYDAGGTADRSVNSDALAARLPAARVRLVRNLAEAESAVRARAADFAAVAVAGARDPGLPELARRLAERQ